MAKVEFWLSYNNGAERLRLPVNPPSIEVDSPFGFEDIEVAQLGEISVVKGRGLKTISLSSFFPRDYNPSYCEYTNIPNPATAVQTLERWRDTKKPIRLTITNGGINMAVTIREFSYTREQAGSPGDIFFTLELKEYRFVTFNKVDTSKKKPGTQKPGGERPGTVVPPKTYTVKKGDNLWTISKRCYGTSNNWRKIYDHNKAKIGKNPNLIYPGQVLVIPNG